MGREEFFSRLNIKDYNNQLEKILEKKSFSEGTKNILLNILYKIETAYEDYKKVKIDVRLKKDILEEVINIIKENCEAIEIIKPKLNEKTKLEDEKFIVQEEKIISYPNEKFVLYALYKLRNKKFRIMDKYDLLKEPMECLLSSGEVLENEEVIRDFDGWNWNIVTEEIENKVYNLVYQNIKILIGNKFMQDNIINMKNIDYIEQLEKEFTKKYGQILGTEIYKEIYKISILEYIKNNNQKREKFLKLHNKLNSDLTKMDNKKEYLQNLANCKKKIGKQIREIDLVINDNKMLRENFIQENEMLSTDKKIFSLSQYSEILQERRKELLLKLEEYSELMKPVNYVKTKTEIREKLNLLKDLKLEEQTEYIINIHLARLQRYFLDGFDKKIKAVETKKEMLELIYVFRYYKLIYIDNKNQIKSWNELSKEITNTEKCLITRACNLKTITILCNNIEENYKVISKILNSNIIDLEEIYLSAKRQEDKILLNIYDDNIIEDTIEFGNDKDISIKFNKKIKLFI